MRSVHDQLIAGLMSQRVVDGLQAIDVTDRHGERLLTAAGNLLIDGTDRFHIGMLALDTGHRIAVGFFTSRGQFLLAPHLFIDIADADDDKPAVLLLSIHADDLAVDIDWLPVHHQPVGH